MESVMETENKSEKSGELSHEGKYLTFVLCGEEYGVEILKVKEIIGIMTITPVPQSPDHVKGVINLRGKVIPIVDLRLKFGMEEKEHTRETCIIVVEVAKIMIGLVVDTVSEVLDISKEEIEHAPHFGSDVSDNLFLGIAKIKNKVKILLDIDKVLESGEIVLVDTGV